MKNFLNRSLSWGVVAVTMATVAVTSCNRDDNNIDNLSVRSALVGGRDIAGATAATNVGLTSNVVVRFNKAVDASTVTMSSVMLMPQGETTGVPAQLTAAGDSIVIDPTTDLLSGTRYTLQLANTLRAADGGRFNGQTFSFTTFGPINVVPPQSGAQIAYFAFNGTFNDSRGTYNPSAVVATEFTTDRKGNAGAAAVFNGTTSIIEIPNGTSLITPSNTVSFWVWVDSTNAQANGNPKNHFVMGANFFRGSQFEFDAKGAWVKNGANFFYGGDSTTTEDLFYNGSGQTRANGGWQGITTNVSRNLREVFPNRWNHIIYTYDAGTRVRSIYVNGQLAMQTDFNLWPDGDSKRRVSRKGSQVAADLSTTWAFGFSKGRDATFWADTDFGDYAKPDANHFKGSLDDVRFFNVALSAAEVNTLYQAER